ncbi:MAG: dihydroorotate dehydrogenase-like protein [Bacteroidales bacterium]
MSKLSTTYMGIKLENPVIAASCGLTGSLASIKTLARSGAGAVVLKSIFEEEILLETNERLREARRDPVIYSELSETLDYIDIHIREDNLNQYLEMIREAKKAVSIPIIASINCVTYEDWTYFTGKIEEAGADALELNLFLNPADFESKEFEKVYFKIIEKVLGLVSIPVSIKISRYFTRLGLTVKALSETGISGIVMFNRFYTPDIDIDAGSMVKGKYFSTPEEQSETLRWIAIMSRRISCDLAASTGIHTGEDVIRMILAGAPVVQVASTLYQNGPDQIGRMLNRIESWMEQKGYDSIEAFRGRVTEEYEKNPAVFERMQFMKHYSEIG